MPKMSIEGAFAAGAAGLLTASVGLGVRVRRRGLRDRAAAYTTIDRPGGGRVEVDCRRPDGATLGVVFSNGLGLPHEQWAWVCAHLPDDVAYVKYNRPGYGLSSRLPKPSRDDQFAIIDELRDEFLGGLPVVMVGHSLGGYLAVAYVAARRDDALSHVVVVDGTNIDDLSASRGTTEELWVRQILLMEVLWAAVGMNVLRPHSTMRDYYAAEVRERFVAFHALPSVWVTAYREYEAAHRDPPVGKVPIPLHVVTALGRIGDPTAHRESQRRLLELSEHSEHHIVEGSDHEQITANEVHAKVIANLVTAGSGT
jgi:pimeloyl-ACP methyl ester carboxylesterase